MSDFTILLISLDNKEGERRRKEIVNYPYIWIKGLTAETTPYDFVKDKMRGMYNRKEVNKNSQIGCFSSHLKAYEYAIEHKLKNVIICEDDAIRKIDIDITALLNSGIKSCLLNGVFAHPTSWKQNPHFDINKAVEWKNGICEIDYSKFRWTNTSAIYYGSYEVIEEILCHIKNSSTIKNIDIYLRREKLINHYFYPNAFYCPSNISQTCLDFKTHKIDLYSGYHKNPDKFKK